MVFFVRKHKKMSEGGEKRKEDTGVCEYKTFTNKNI